MPSSLLVNSKFFIRLFPCAPVDWECIKIERNNTVIYVRSLQDIDSNKNNLKTKDKFWRFTADYIFNKSSQQQLYDKVLYNIVNYAFLGVDSVVLSFGQTCSGKTYTSLGFENPLLKGIIPRLISEIFQKKANCNKLNVVLSMSIVEICGERIWDLLSKPVKPCDKIKNVERFEMKSEEKATKMLNKILRKRGVILHAPYAGANYGAVVVTYDINVTNVVDCKPVITKSKIHCVDLPGVETTGRNQLTSFKDAVNQGKANLNKTFLEQMVLLLKTRHEEKINYRSHSLIEYLGKSLSVKNNLRFIGHIRPTHEDLSVTISVLRLGMIIQMLKNGTGKPNICSIPDTKFQELEKKVTSLESEMLQRKLIYDEDPINNLTHSHLELIRAAIVAFTEGNTTEFHLMSITEAPIAFIMFKEVFLEKEAQRKQSEMEATLLALEELKIKENYLSTTLHSKTDMLKELAELSVKTADDLTELTTPSEHEEQATTPSTTVAGSSSKAKKMKPGLKKNAAARTEPREIDIRALQENVIRIEYLLSCIFNKPSLISEILANKIDEAISNVIESQLSVYTLP